jgi:ATP-dependent exoDNAse (exonuclease V) alpha subunit
VEYSGAKLIAVGDGKQLPSIGPGGMFDRLQTTPRPLSYRRFIAPRTPLSSERGRRCAPGNAVQDWIKLAREHHNIRQVALIADASNQEIDRLNARAQHLRLEHGELGQREIPLPEIHDGIRPR